jgi:hypothetical protein
MPSIEVDVNEGGAGLRGGWMVNISLCTRCVESRPDWPATARNTSSSNGEGEHKLPAGLCLALAASLLKQPIDLALFVCSSLVLHPVRHKLSAYPSESFSWYR